MLRNWLLEKLASPPVESSPHAIIGLSHNRLVQDMLSSLEIQNFKGIKQGKLEDLAQVNILVGRNNSGKSTVLDALLMMRCAIVGLDLLDTNGLEHIIKRRVDRGQVDYDELWFRMDTEDPIILTAELDGKNKISERWQKNLQGVIRCDEIEHHFSNNHNSPKHQQSTPLWHDLVETVGDAGASLISQMHMVDATAIHYPYAEKLWSELIKDRKDDKVRQILEEIYGLPINYITAMRFPKKERLVAALPHVGLAVDWFGDGFRFAVNILALGVFLTDTALLVEELETHQHPESLRKLTETLFELAKQQNLQLFLTTHSMELITYALEAAEEKQIDLKLHHLSLDKEGSLKSIPMSLPTTTMLLDIGHDPRLHYKYIGAE